jgi:hypothetical protein
VGLLDKLIRGVNWAAEPVQDVQVFYDRKAVAGDRLAEGGTPTNAQIVGIKRDLNDGDRYFIALEVAGERHGLQIRFTVAGMSRLRLGLGVMAKTDGKDVVLDWDAMTTLWGIDAGMTTQRRQRKAPRDGIEEKALDMRVEKRLKTWTPGTATITRLEPVFAMGMATENWDVHLQLPDGTASLSARDNIPFYARWYAAPGTSVPVATDPADPTKAVVDWRTVALAGTPGDLADRPPEGSAAALATAQG